MRAGLVIYGGLEFPSGGFLYDRMLVETLRQAGDEVDVISLPWQSYGRCVGHNFDPVLRERLRRWSGDVMLQDELVHPSLFFLNRTIRPAIGAPIVSIVHHLRSFEHRGLFSHGIARLAERAYLRSVDGFIFNGEATRRAVHELRGAPGPGIVASPGGDRLCGAMTDAEVIARAADAPPLRVLFVGNIIERKGLVTLLEALSASPPGAWQLTVVGSRSVDPAHARHVDRFVKERGLQERVLMKDHLDDGQLAGAFRAHHVLAVPSSYEGYGIVYLEAMGFGVVPIGTTSGGAAEVIENRENGFLVSPGDRKALAALILRLGADRDLLGSCARSALRRFHRAPGWKPRMTEVREWLLAFVNQGRH
jgi:glycosyltransferase involved in cell wall biosynthesis